MTWNIVFTKDAICDKKKLEKSPNLLKKALYILEQMKENHFFLPYEKLVGNFSGCYSKRLNIQHRLIYQVYKDEKVIKILSMWEHYE